MEMERIYRLNGEITDLTAIMEHLEDLLQYGSNTKIWQDLGIDFEDYERYNVNIKDFLENAKHQKEEYNELLIADNIKLWTQKQNDDEYPLYIELQLLDYNTKEFGEINLNLTTETNETIEELCTYTYKDLLEMIEES